LKEPPFLDGALFTEEHVIPRALGGVLAWHSLCAECNSLFGRTFERRAKSDPAIRRAIHRLKDKLPDLFAEIEEGQPYILESGGRNLPGVFRKGRVVPLTREVDGDLWVSADNAEQSVKKKLRKAGLSPNEVEDAWKRYVAAPESTPVDLGGGLAAMSHPTYILGPDLSQGEALTPLVSLKIAYEFAVLSFGAVMLGDNPALNEVRRALLEGDAASPVFNVEPKITRDRKAEPFHGIAFEGNKPHAVIQVRLFGLLAYRVNLPNLGIHHKAFGYRLDLDTGEEGCAYRDQE
jgi:hypothetical protein